MNFFLFPKGVPVIKRLLDILFSLLVLVLFSPILILISLLVLITLGSPILFRQNRPGYKSKIFEIFKFRTMRSGLDQDGNLLPDEQRITSLGKALRSLSLDELPEVINILRGEMSWVGPRPLLVEYLDRYNTEQIRRHDVLPGLTGWAQIHGRNVLTWEDKFTLDVWYVDNWSLWLDIKIFFMTIWKVITREGINQAGHISAEVFMGNKENSGTEKTN